MRNFASIWNNLLKDSISAEFLLMEVYAQVALQNKLFSIRRALYNNYFGKVSSFADFISYIFVSFSSVEEILTKVS